MTSAKHNKSNQDPVPQTSVLDIDGMDNQFPEYGPSLPITERPIPNAAGHGLQHLDTSRQDVSVGPDTDPFEIFDQISTLPLPPMPSNFFDGIPGMDSNLETEGPGDGNRSPPDTDPSPTESQNGATSASSRSSAEGAKDSDKM